MAWLRNLGIGTRLSLAFMLVVLLLIGVAVFGVTSLAGMNASLHLTVEGRLLKVIDLGHVKQDALEIGVIVRDAALTEDPALVQQNTQRIDGMRKEMGATLDALGKLIAASGRPDLQKTFSDLTSAREAYNGQLDMVLRQLGAGEFAGARAALVVTLPAAQRPYFEKLDEIMDGGRNLALAAVKQADAGFVWTRNVLLGLTALAVLLAVLMGTAITRSITGPAREALEAAEALATGNLRHTFNVRSSDEMGRMLAALERAFRHLAALVHGIQQASGSIDGATREIARGNTDLSQRTEQQAASLEQTAASMEQLTSTVRQNADNARQANQLAVNASDVATEGGRVVRDVVQTMDSISKSSSQVADITGVIESIAFQTNILALNAAVEAARAGEQGRGFAVVASEVRNLAQRSSAAAKEIAELIGGSVRQVQDGARQAEQAGKTMDDIVGAVRRVTDIMGEISAASTEQTSGIEQVSLAVTQMESMTQQNAALVEQAAAAAESLMQQAGGLVNEVGRFDVAQGSPATLALDAVVPPRQIDPAPLPPMANPAALAAPRARAAAVPAATRPPVQRKPQSQAVLTKRAPAVPAKERPPVGRQRQEPVLKTALRRPAGATQTAMADSGDWETF
ncbi:MCP four helix bundle domain-containing protein [Cupriavidus pinatubonensis]|uniref:methyl-accepting chemotaxis protein n=1 Tax=Cupriavidus pinatubonensis TaxID=248026 RepID=UPI00112D1E84|nr:methyl-accepting chemotaxis protein [Cupriavidus pinatubonensis]QYY27918.1 MCP four helix bundle domain-containing protein [Cupriavidus pinatubonensis]TPQ41630.1 histidine kinase [Cupriavidus pinatubonensis]